MKKVNFTMFGTPIKINFTAPLILFRKLLNPFYCADEYHCMGIDAFLKELAG